MSLGSEVHDSVNFLGLEYVGNKVGRTYVALDKLEVWQLFELVEVGQARAVIELIVNDNIVLRVLVTEQNSDMGSNEA